MNREKSQLRRTLRQQRQALSAVERLTASGEAGRWARTFPSLLQAGKILSYAPVAGELSPAIVESQLGARIYLPRITHYRNATMQFLPRAQGTRLNRYAIEEPAGLHDAVTARQLDAVLVPLVGFMRDGTRLGMGGGFYDRAFAHRLREGCLARPLLIGLGYAFQECESLPREAWDVPLDGIITDRELIITRQ